MHLQRRGPKQSRLDCLNTLINTFNFDDIIIEKCSINDLI